MNKMQLACREAYSNYILNIICPDLKSNPKSFWSFISSKRCGNSAVAPLFGYDDLTYTSTKIKADILNTQFVLVFNRDEHPTALPHPSDQGHPTTMANVEVTYNGVTKPLNKLNPHKAKGSNMIPVHLFKTLADYLGPLLTILFKSSLVVVLCLMHGKMLI